MAVTDSLKDTIVLETSGVTRENLASALSMVEGCWKSSSLLWMQANGFPVLPGLILGGWTQASQEAVDGFCRGRNVSGLLVRIEKPGQRWTRRRGGYIISADRARELVEELRREGMIALLLEPASPYMDLFSLTSVSDLDTGKVEAEVVGHGFDASDILRGDITPHERFEISFDPGRAQSKLSTKFRAKRTFIIKPETYRASVQRRLIKIGARLRSPSFPDELMNSDAPASSLKDLANEAMGYLRTSGQTALPDHISEYEPIPEQLLEVFLTQLRRLIERVVARNPRWRTFSVASSLLSPHRLAIWDFFPPGDHDTSVLTEL